ncbi:DUF2264 domain-containing protein [Arthrobacter sp. ISL-69]|uniref:DUF2264 domain-containing protein n=1 Tax=Arthrobacter sp. ISL-69 TaxID=2819113 RepID=UPI00203610F2|nr:DUF2264 domain-containing protein [Arthrobacter sp. ISL-69]
MLRSVQRYATDDHANLYLPGANSHYGPHSDSLEGFARTFLLASFRIAGDPEGTGWIADWYAAGLDAGTNPANPDRWPTPREVQQAKVEAASLAVGLALTREVLWEKLPPRVKEQLIAWFETVIGEEYPPINWVWFQIVVEMFLTSVGGRFSNDDIDAGLALHDSLHRLCQLERSPVGRSERYPPERPTKRLFWHERSTRTAADLMSMGLVMNFLEGPR